MKVLRVL